MLKRTLVTSFFATIALCALLSPAYSQDPQPGVSPTDQHPAASPAEQHPVDSPGEHHPIVSLAAQQVMPGNQAYLTVMSANVENVDLTSLEQWIEFPKDKLTLVTVRTAIAADLVEAELKYDVEAKDEISTLHILIKGKKSIPDGPVAEITFTVPENVSEQTVTLKHKAEGMGADGKKLETLVVHNGEIRISKVPLEKVPGIMSCFFYMH